MLWHHNGVRSLLISASETLKASFFGSKTPFKFEHCLRIILHANILHIVCTRVNRLSQLINLFIIQHGLSVIPAKAGIQSSQVIADHLDSSFPRSDLFFPPAHQLISFPLYSLFFPLYSFTDFRPPISDLRPLSYSSVHP